MYWCKVDAQGNVSDIQAFNGTQSLPNYHPIHEMPSGYGPWIYDSNTQSAIINPKKHIAEPPQPDRVDLFEERLKKIEETLAIIAKKLS